MNHYVYSDDSSSWSPMSMAEKKNERKEDTRDLIDSRDAV